MGSNDSLNFAGDKSLGIDFAAESASAEHELGMIARDSKGREYCYVLATAVAIAVSVPVKIATGWTVAAAGNAGVVFGVTHVARTASYYGWVQIRGEVDSNVVDSLAAGTGVAAISDANGDLAAAAETAIGLRGVCLVTEDATEIVSVFLF